MSKLFWLLAFLFLVTDIPDCFGCMCMVNPYMAPKEQLYCDANYAIKATVIEKKSWMHRMIEYTMVIDNVFKGHKDLAIGDVMTFKTSGSGLQCGVTDLEEGAKYLITGPPPIPDFGYGLSICQWIEKFTKLTQEEKNGLRGEYRLFCSDY